MQGPGNASDFSKVAADLEVQRARERRAKELALREENKRVWVIDFCFSVVSIIFCQPLKLAEQKQAEKLRQKTTDAKYVESTEQFMDSFGRSLR